MKEKTLPVSEALRKKNVLAKAEIVTVQFEAPAIQTVQMILVSFSCLVFSDMSSERLYGCRYLLFLRSFEW